jgi:transposase-like protein
LGGFKENGESIVVELDETVIYKRKYNRGQCPKQRWLFGGLERVSKKCFLGLIPNRKADTLLQEIHEHCLPGSLLLTDGLASYKHLNVVFGGIYAHDIVVHEHNFVNPDDALVHTQSVESMWSSIKRKNRIRKGTHSAVLKSYLEEFMWRRNFVGEKNSFSCFLVCIFAKYPF